MNFRNIAFAGALALAVGLSVAGRAGVDRAAVEAALKQVPHVEYGDDRAPLDLLDRAAGEAHSDPALRAHLEDCYIAVLEGGSTVAGKDYACRALRLVGTEKSIPALAALLPHPQLTGLARFALEPMPYPAVDAALRDALPRLQPRQQIGVLTSLAARRDAGAVPVIAPLTRHANARLAQAAIIALGKIGTPKAADILLKLLRETDGERRALAAQGCLEVGWSLLEDGHAGRAAPVFTALLETYPDGFRHEAAFEGLVAAEPGRAAERLLAALRGDNDRLRKVAGRLVAELPVAKTPRAFLTALPDLPPAGQVILLQAFAKRGDRATRRAVVGRLKRDVPFVVRRAAVQALGSVGGPADVPRLARLAAGRQKALAAAARASLLDLSAPGVDAALVQKALDPAGKTAMRVVLIQALANRNAHQQAGALVAGLKDADPAVRQEVAKALAILGGAAEIPALVEQLAATSDEARRAVLVRTLELICGRVGEAASAPLRAGLSGASPQTRAALLRLFSAVGGNEALATLRRAVRDSDPAVRDAAVRAMSEWPDASAAADLVAVIKQADTPAHRALAFRGYVRLVRESGLQPDAKFDHLKAAMQWAANDGERRLVIGALADAPSVRALQWVAEYLKNPALVNESGAAAVAIARTLGAAHQDAIRPVLESVIQRVTAKPVRDSANELKQKLKL